VDLLEAAFLEMKEGDLDSYSIQVLQKYIEKMDTQSDYMAFLCQNQLGDEAKMSLSQQLIMDI
jgi:hypothetical protein